MDGNRPEATLTQGLVLAVAGGAALGTLRWMDEVPGSELCSDGLRGGNERKEGLSFVFPYVFSSEARLAGCRVIGINESSCRVGDKGRRRIAPDAATSDREKEG
ncbi:hypothetical protein HPB50_007353 [Hyalomma asiaticum]|uniref:Uncharacterized protein n=1 Tax=Hyalomma asiaticum TaxID=266040 RepID=A0ACB7SW63_HYAAI|nr:hypothetical protein HPB50_007353 [Hyalomma asiaticum]